MYMMNSGKVKVNGWPQFTWPHCDLMVNIVCTSFDASWWDEHNQIMCVAVATFYPKLLAKNGLLTLDDVTWPHGCPIARIASRYGRIVMTDVIRGRVCYYNEYLWKMSHLIFPHWLPPNSWRGSHEFVSLFCIHVYVGHTRWSSPKWSHTYTGHANGAHMSCEWRMLVCANSVMRMAR